MERTENCCEPAVLLALESCVLTETKDGLGAERRLVGLLDAVAYPHEGEEVLVHLSLELVVFLLRILAFHGDCS